MPQLEAPADEAGIVAAVQAALARRKPLAVEGNGTKRTMLRPVQAAAALSTRNLVGITLYSPSELIVSAWAGTPVATLEAALAEKNQMLVAEPPDLSALLGTEGAQTLGGAVAANLSGPRRITAGAMRDHVMGIRAVNGTGELIRSGGRVLKNVTGLDLCKLLSGSHGTLGILTEVTLKVLPRPESSGSLLLPGLDATAGVAALSAALGAPFGVSAAAWLPAEAAARVPELADHGPVALLRIEDFAPSVAYRLDRLAALLPPGHRLDDETSQSAWQAIRDAKPLEAAPDHAIWRVSVRPSRGPAVLAPAQAAGAAGFLDWGGGLAWLAGPPEAHAAITEAARTAGGNWTLLRGPAPMRTAVDVIPPEPAPLAAITRRVKAAMDPAGILNPGRMTAGL